MPFKYINGKIIYVEHATVYGRLVEVGFGGSYRECRICGKPMEWHPKTKHHTFDCECFDTGRSGDDE